MVQNHNISIAVDSPNGLVVPNIKNVQQLSILAIQHELNRLKRDAESGRVHLRDLQEGTIAISNIGTVGATYTAPVIMPPQVCIAGIGRIQTLPRYMTKKRPDVSEESELQPRKIVKDILNPNCLLNSSFSFLSALVPIIVFSTERPP